METIVVGVDGSDSSYRALEWATAEARLRQAKLRVVHAWFETFVYGLYARPVVYEHESAEEAARECLDKAVASIPAGSPEVIVEPVLQRGQPEPILTQQAESSALLVVGSRGRGNLAEVMLGSVSRYVLHHAACPVVVVH
jgi:nucleotide-binding universal stress UspA family protein